MPIFLLVIEWSLTQYQIHIQPTYKYNMVWAIILVWYTSRARVEFKYVPNLPMLEIFNSLLDPYFVYKNIPLGITH